MVFDIDVNGIENYSGEELTTGHKKEDLGSEMKSGGFQTKRSKNVERR